MTDQEWGALAAAVTGAVGSPLALSVEHFASRLSAAMQAAAWDTQSFNDLGNRLFHAAAYGHAAACYRIAAQDVQAYGATANLGRCEIRLGEAASAESRARVLVHDYPQASAGWQLLSEALAALQRMPEALEAARHAAMLAGDNAVLARSWATLALQVGDIESAVQAFALAWQRQPDDFISLGMLLFNRRRLCLWDDIDALSARLLAALEHGQAESLPFDVLAEPSSAAQQVMCAKRQAAHIKRLAERQPLERRSLPVSASARLKVGFISHGFGPHATSVLAAGLFEALRNSSLEVHLFSTREDGESAMRRRLADAAHTFHDLPGLAQREVAARIQAEEIELLLDLDGYSRVRLPEVCAYRPAPLQVNWLAYPGTFGADYIDYIIADRFVLPPSMQPHFAEKAAYLPRCYQCSDVSRAIVPPPSRQACGLPPTGVVYACFNTSFKLNPHSIQRMFQILAAVPGSVLWLLQGEGEMARRLRLEATRAGIDASRLVFLERLPHQAYLSRYRHVDLFLDTEHYNAHTVASDALWAGCPVLTRPGDTFASRVAGSLNHHLGMPEMNAADDAAFVMKAVRFGRDADYRAAVKAKLLKQRVQSGLFDIKGFSADFETLLLRMAAHRRAGMLPETFES